jgi:hypothetical protein
MCVFMHFTAGGGGAARIVELSGNTRSDPERRADIPLRVCSRAGWPVQKYKY